MKKFLFSLLVAITAISSFGQIKISALPEYTNPGDAGYIPIVIGGVTYRVTPPNANATVLATKAPIASPTFTGTATTPNLAVTGSATFTNQSSAPSTPAAGKITNYTATNGGYKPEFKSIDEDGAITEYQSKLANGRFDWWYPAIGNTSTSFSATGNNWASTTVTARAIATTNIFTQANRCGFVSAATASSLATIRGNTLQYHRGASAGMGGYELTFVMGFSASSTPADRKAFVGLYTTATANPTGGTNPTSFTNSIGFSCDLAVDNNWNVMTNDNSGTATTTTLGANFPANTNNTDLYLFRIYCKSNDTKVYYYVKNLSTGNEAAGTVTSDLPVNTDSEGWMVYVTNGTTASADAIDVAKVLGYKPYN